MVSRRRGRLRATHALRADGAQMRALWAQHEASAEQSDAQSGSSALIFLVAGLLVGSALISLPLLWFASKVIRWLLHG
jgi:uncharacterized oligopeptide transporter (OPT) family protein